MNKIAKRLAGLFMVFAAANASADGQEIDAATDPLILQNCPSIGSTPLIKLPYNKPQLFPQFDDAEILNLDFKIKSEDKNTQDLANKVQSTNNKTHLILNINSTGGDFQIGFNKIIVPMLQSTRPTTTICNIFAGSMAGHVLLSARFRTAVPSCKLSFHEPTTNIPGYVDNILKQDLEKFGQADPPIKRHIEELSDANEHLIKYLSERAKLPEACSRSLIQRGDSHIIVYGQTLLELGIVNARFDNRANWMQLRREDVTLPPERN